MFGDVGQARTNAAMLLLLIDTTSSRTCTKPIVGSSAILSKKLENANIIMTLLDRKNSLNNYGTQQWVLCKCGLKL